MALTQSHFRFGINELAESTHGFLAAEDKPIVLPPGRTALLRFCVQATGGVAESNVALQFQYQRNGGGWVDITTTSAVARTGSTTVFTNGQNCTKRLSGTGTFETTAAGCTHDGSSGGANMDIVANGNAETEMGFQIINADTTIGDLIEFRLVRVGGTLLTSYAVTPSLRVGIEALAIQSRDTSLHTSLSAAGTRITDKETIVRVVGIPNADLSDPTLTMEMKVWGTTDQQADPPDESYDIPLQAETWQGGFTGKAGTIYAGMPIPPGFSFHQDLAADIRRVRATFQPSRTVNPFGADATIVAVG